MARPEPTVAPRSPAATPSRRGVGSPLAIGGIAVYALAATVIVALGTGRYRVLGIVIRPTKLRRTMNGLGPSVLVLLAASPAALLLPLAGSMAAADGLLGPLPLVETGDAIPAVSREVARLPPGSVLVEFPFGDGTRDVRFTYYSVSNLRPILSGYSGYFASTFLAPLPVPAGSAPPSGRRMDGTAPIRRHVRQPARGGVSPARGGAVRGVPRESRRDARPAGGLRTTVPAARRTAGV